MTPSMFVTDPGHQHLVTSPLSARMSDVGARGSLTVSLETLCPDGILTSCLNQAPI